MRPIVITEKHIVQQSVSSVTSGNISNVEVLDTVAAPTALNEVREGSRISAVYVEMWLSVTAATQGSAIVTLEKRGGGQPAMTAANSASLGSYPNKKNVLFTFQGLIAGNDQYPMVVIKGWIKVPKSKQRFGLGDGLFLNVHGQSTGANFCGFFIYKEQY